MSTPNWVWFSICATHGKIFLIKPIAFTIKVSEGLSYYHQIGGTLSTLPVSEYLITKWIQNAMCIFDLHI